MNPPKKARSTGKSADEESETPVDAVELLTSDHREVEQLFERCSSAEDGRQKQQLVREIATALTIHTLIEEEIFYPTCREKGVDTGPLDEAQVEHDGVKMLLEELLDSDPQEDEFYDAKITVLSQYVKHHVNEEEKEDDGLFSRAKTAGLDMNDIGSKLKSLKNELSSPQKRSRLRPEFKSFHHQQQEHQEQPMGRYASDWEGRGGYGRDYDEDYRGSPSRYYERGEPSQRRSSGDYRGYGRQESQYGGRNYRGEGYRGEGGRGRSYYGGSGEYHDMPRGYGGSDEGDQRGHRRMGGYDEPEDYGDYGRRGRGR